MNAYLLIVTNESTDGCGASDGGRFDLSDACPTCGTGARRIDPISMPKGRLPDHVFRTYRGEIIVPPRLVESIRILAPQCLRAVRGSGTDEWRRHGELIPEVTLPKWDSRTTGWTTSQMLPPCTGCRRDGFYNLVRVPLLLAYSGALPSFHVAQTYECFGRSVLRADFAESRFAKPNPVVSEAIKDLLFFEEGLEFDPVTYYP